MVVDFQDEVSQTFPEARGTSQKYRDLATRFNSSLLGILIGMCCRGSFWRQDRKILSPHGSRDLTIIKTEVTGRIAKNSFLQSVLGFWGPFKL